MGNEKPPKIAFTCYYAGHQLFAGRIPANGLERGMSPWRAMGEPQLKDK
jgi:hypothetical protein